MVLVPPGAVGLKFWRPLASDKRTANAWNVEDKTANVVLSNNDKTATLSSTDTTGVRSTTGRMNGAAGKYYIEFLVSTAGGTTNFGLKTRTAVIDDPATQTIRVIGTSGNIVLNTATKGNVGGAVTNGDVICLAWDSGAETVWARKNNGFWNNNATADPATGASGLDFSAVPNVEHHLWYNSFNVGEGTTLRTELADFTYSVPSGFTSWMSEALPEVAGTGDLAGQEAAVSGAGDVGSAEATGSGAVAADAAAVSGSGVSASTGTGALAAQTAAVAGAGASASIGSGALAAQAAAASGAGAVASTGVGALAAQAATVAGSGLSVSAGTGALQAAAAAVVGAGASASTGTGSLVAGSAEVAGTGTAAAANSGALVAQAATVAGLGVSASIGTGALQAGAAAIAGAGLVASAGAGNLVAGPTTVTGQGVVLEEGAAVGSGALVAGAATLSGEGEVTGEIAPPVSVGGGWWPQWRPVAVEGVGYAILPELEGEAHGLVVAVGAGAKALPRVAGTSAGTVAVVGRSVARLTVKVEAVGERGQAGAARAVLKGLLVAGVGVAGARGSASGVVLELKGAAVGRHDDDEAAILALLLAA